MYVVSYICELALCVCFQELMKSTVDLADLIGLYFVMTKIAGKGQLKFMIAGLGWATAELICTRYKPKTSSVQKMLQYQYFLCSNSNHFAPLLCFRVIPFWVGARGIEFDWKYIQMSFQSNINLVSCAHFFSSFFLAK